MFLTTLLYVALFAGAAAVVFSIVYLTEESLRRELKTNLPETSFADVEDYVRKVNGETSMTYKIKARQRNGTTKDVEIHCKSSCLKRGQRVRI